MATQSLENAFRERRGAAATRNLALEPAAFRDTEGGFEVPRALRMLPPLPQGASRAKCFGP